MDADQKSLVHSSAGMRLIAQMTLFNRGDFARLKQYLGEYYHETALGDQPAATRLAELKAIYRLAGKMRVEQVIGAGKHDVAVILATERGGFFLTRIAVDEDYPHKVTAFSQHSVDVNEGPEHDQSER